LLILEPALSLTIESKIPLRQLLSQQYNAYMTGSLRKYESPTRQNGPFVVRPTRTLTPEKSFFYCKGRVFDRTTCLYWALIFNLIPIDPIAAHWHHAGYVDLQNIPR
jgi:hypothetical protein